MNKLKKIMLISCLFLSIGAVEVNAQSAQKQTNPRIEAQMSEQQVKLQKLDPNTKGVTNSLQNVKTVKDSSKKKSQNLTSNEIRLTN